MKQTSKFFVLLVIPTFFFSTVTAHAFWNPFNFFVIKKPVVSVVQELKNWVGFTHGINRFLRRHNLPKIPRQKTVLKMRKKREAPKPPAPEPAEPEEPSEGAAELSAPAPPEKPSVQEPQEPKAPAVEPSAEEPSVEEPPVVEPSAEEPSVEEPPVVEPSAEEPSVEEPPVAKPQEVEEPSVPQDSNVYPWHYNIMTTMFWIGEEPSADNNYVSNVMTAWEEPVADSTNPYYAAVPYNDVESPRRTELPWYDPALDTWNYSFMKNRFIEVRANGKTLYAQIEDVGPTFDDDYSYVILAKTPPKNPDNYRAGLDLSPAATKFLGLDGLDPTDWRFVDEELVPPEWKVNMETEQCNWEK